jgi:glycosyltransferase involved in cell wall biosynthesis
MLEPWAWRHKFWKKLPYYYCFERAQLKSARVVLATSEQEAANLSRFVSSKRIRSLPLGLSDACPPAYGAARQKLGWSPDELVLLFLSRIHPKKGLHLLLRALAAIAPEMPAKWRLVIVGDGEEKYLAHCRQIARSNDLVSRRAEWKGAVWGKEKWPYFQGADLFCLPSFSENFGLAVMEACQVGTRALTTRDTPWSFLGKEGAAFLVEPDVASVQQGLRAFLKAAAWSLVEREALSQRIQERFGWPTVGPKYVELYQQIACSSKDFTPQLLA